MVVRERQRKREKAIFRNNAYVGIGLKINDNEGDFIIIIKYASFNKKKLFH